MILPEKHFPELFFGGGATALPPFPAPVSYAYGSDVSAVN